MRAGGQAHTHAGFISRDRWRYRRGRPWERLRR